MKDLDPIRTASERNADNDDNSKQPAYKDFVRDKRTRIHSAKSDQKVVYRKRFSDSADEYAQGYGKQRDSYDRSNNYTPTRKRSFNPNFDANNRLISRRDDDSRTNRTYRPNNERDFDGNRDYRSENYDRYPNNRYRSDRYSNREDYERRDSRMSDNRYDNRKPSGHYGDRREYQSERNGNSYGNRKQQFRYGDNSAKKDFKKGGFQKNSQRRNYDSDNYPTFPVPVTDEKIRLNRYISMSGICSRREADEYIQSGVVSVNGMVVTELGARVSQSDEIRFHGEIIKNERKVYILMNKPKGYVTSLDDPHADKTVMDLLKNGCRERVYPVGRLDKNSLGVLLITNDGDMAKKLMHPSFEKKKIYQVSIDKPLTAADMNALADGFELEDGEIHADSVSYVAGKKTEIGIEIHSGRNRIVRRMFEHLGYRVVKLDRVYFAGLTKKNLKRGEWRFLTPREVQNLRSGQYE